MPAPLRRHGCRSLALAQNRFSSPSAAAASPAQAGEGAKRTVTEELDNWDENVEDEWEEADADADEAAAGKSSKRAE